MRQGTAEPGPFWEGEAAGIRGAGVVARGTAGPGSESGTVTVPASLIFKTFVRTSAGRTVKSAAGSVRRGQDPSAWRVRGPPEASWTARSVAPQHRRHTNPPLPWRLVRRGARPDSYSGTCPEAPGFLRLGAPVPPAGAPGSYGWGWAGHPPGRASFSSLLVAVAWPALLVSVHLHAAASARRVSEGSVSSLSLRGDENIFCSDS